MGSTGVELKLAGASKSIIIVPSLDSTVGELKLEIAKATGHANPQDLKLIVGGKRLLDDLKALKDYGVTAAPRILVLGLQSAEAQKTLADQEARGREQQERAERLQRLKAAASELAKRSMNNSVGEDKHYDLALENQHGDAIMLDKADQEALIMGLSLHDRGKGLMEKEDYRGALDILLVSEEAFSCCNSSIKHSADNEGLLMLDIVWCYFQLRDAASLGAATERLGKARSWLQRSHGPNLERMKVLHGDFTPELTTYVRLELLEGVGAFHAGDNAKAKAALEGALAKWERLQVSDDRLAELLAMGFTSSEATRGLRFCAGDCERAVGFIMEQRRLQRERKYRQRQERRLRAEQRSYGRCPNGLHVDMQLLERLTLLGYERQLAAEALRQVSNDIQVALDILSNPMANASLQQHLATIKQASNKRTKHTVDEVAVASLVSMGFPESDARQALERCAGRSDVLQAAMEYLLSLTAEGSTGTQADAEVPQATDGSNGMEQEGQAATAEQAGPSAAPEHAVPVRQPSNSPGTSSKGSDRDEEMEEELTSSARTDPMSAYDIDVSQEGAAIQEYMALLGSCNV